MGIFVDNQLTQLAPTEAAGALSDGYLKVTGRRPTWAILLLLIAQSALETGNWQFIHNFNFGNVRGESPDGLYTSFKAGEVENGKEVTLEAGDPRNKFRAYRTAADGAADYIRALRDKPHWWAGLHTGTIDGFIKGLTTYPAYFTANATRYAHEMEAVSTKYLSLAKLYGTSTSFWAVIGAGIAAFTGFKAVRHYQSK